MTTLPVLPSYIPVNGITAVPLALVSIVLINVLRQVFFKRRNEPPVVFHWVPVIGSTVTYGIDPFKFFFQCQKKVHILISYFKLTDGIMVDGEIIVWGCIYIHSARQESHRVFGIQGQSIHPKRETQGRQRRGNICRPHHAVLWRRCDLRCAQR